MSEHEEFTLALTAELLRSSARSAVLAHKLLESLELQWPALIDSAVLFVDAAHALSPITDQEDK